MFFSLSLGQSVISPNLKGRECNYLFYIKKKLNSIFE